MSKMSYHNRILRVNLSTGQASTERPGDAFYRKYLGGRGIISYYLYRELAPGIDPLSPENKLIFAAGPLTGTAFIGGGRNSVGAKSPLTGAYGDAEAGGFFGAEIRRAGYDALIVEGKATHPVYLAIKDDEVEIKDARHMWGKLTADVQDEIQKEMDDSRVRVAQIGPAGEKGVKYSHITNDLTHFYGRTGMGAVMGSKNLRAIGIRGTRIPQPADAKKLAGLSKWMSDNWEDMIYNMHDLGTPGILLSLNALGGLPTRNFREGTFEGANTLSGEFMNETVLIDREGCFACPVRCKRVVKSEVKYSVNPVYGGPEYETLAALGSNCGVADMEVVCKGNELCNALGLDTISTGVAVAFAMECYEAGILPPELSDGLELNFGNGDVMIALIQKIAQREEGLGYLLSEGVKKASQVIGSGAEAFAMEVKGQELPMHEPRFKQGMGIGYQVSPTGADHCHNLMDSLYTTEGKALDNARAIGLNKALPLDLLNAEKAHMLKVVINWRNIINSVEYCQFLPWTPKQVEEALNAATGWGTSLVELMQIAERIVTLNRLFNIREGFTDQDDYLPKRFYEPLIAEGPTSGVALDFEAAKQTRLAYYALMGWDEKGVPTQATLSALDLLWTQEEN